MVIEQHRTQSYMPDALLRPRLHIDHQLKTYQEIQMGEIDQRDGVNMDQELSVGTTAAISVAGTLLIIAFVALIFLLYRAITNHRRLLADLEQRGVSIQRPTLREDQSNPVKPRRVLQRSSFIPFGSGSEWKTLDSQEKITPQSQPAAEAGFDGPKQQARRTSWGPWRLTHRIYNRKPIQMKAIGNSRLSAIIESPQNRIDRPATATLEDNERPSTTGATRCDLSDSELFCTSPFATSAQGRSDDDLRPSPLFSVSASNPTPNSAPRMRSRAMTEGTTIRPVLSATSSGDNQPAAIKRHVRSLSLGSWQPGTAPDAPVPPLPLTIRKEESSRPRSWVIDRSISRMSGSSFESIGSSLLVASPNLQRSQSARALDRLKYGGSSSIASGPRPLNYSLSVRKRTVPSPESQERVSVKSSAARYSHGSFDGEIERAFNDASSESGRCQLSSTVRVAQRVSLNRISKASASGIMAVPAQGLRTPRRGSRFLTTPNGSPASRGRNSGMADAGSSHGVPSRQLSQTTSISRASSTRSSNGNPFQWDPSPMAPTKPSALKGSPTARKGHRRQNCVRISLPATVMAIQRRSRSSSPVMGDIKEESPTTNDPLSATNGPGFSARRALPRPPSSTTFNPELKTNPTMLRASLTPSSPTLSLVNYTQESFSCEPSKFSFTSSPLGISKNRDSTTSVFTIPSFPSPGKGVGTKPLIPPPTFSFTRPSNEYEQERTETLAELNLLAQPFNPELKLVSGSLLERQTLKAPSPPPSAGDEQRSSQNDGLEIGGSTSHKTNATAAGIFDLSSFDTAPRDWNGAPEKRTASSQDDSPQCSPKTTFGGLPAPKDRINQGSTNPHGIAPACEEYVIRDIDESDARILHDLDSTQDPEDGRTLLPQTRLLGPRPSPASPIRASITKLRRMNSNAKDESYDPGMRAARRYINFGREASIPILEIDSMLGIGSKVGSSRQRSDGGRTSPSLALGCARLGGLGEEAENKSMFSPSFDSNKADDRMWKQCNPDEVILAQSAGNLGMTNDHPSDQAIAGAEQNLGYGTSDNGEVCTYIDKSGREDICTSVWEDGESFWDSNELRVSTPPVQDTPLANGSVLSLLTSVNSNVMECDGGKVVLEHRRLEALKRERDTRGVPSLIDKEKRTATRIIGINVLPPSSSPGQQSLYDENGFLKT